MLKPWTQTESFIKWYDDLQGYGKLILVGEHVVVHGVTTPHVDRA